MLHELTDALAARLLAAFPADRAYAPSDLAADPMPRPVAHFLTCRLQERVAAERETLRQKRSGWLDYGAPAVQQAEQQLKEALEQHARIAQGAWAPALRDAAEHVLLYLVRPVHALVSFAFGKEDGALPADRILRRADYFAAYPYLREAASAYARRKQLTRLERTQFTALLTRVDQHMTADYDADEWLRLLAPLYEAAAVAAEESSAFAGGVPASLLRTFFSAKAAAAPARRLAEYEAHQPVSHDALRRLLTAPAPEASEAPRPKARQSKPGALTSEAPATPPAPEAPARKRPQPSHEDAPVPLWQQFRGGAGDGGGTRPAKTPAPPLRETPREPAVADARPLWQQFRPAQEAVVPPDAQEEAAPPGAQEANDALSLDRLEAAVLGRRAEANRTRFVRVLFGGSEDDYARVLRLLQAAGSWRTASQIIARDVFRAHQVNIYGDPAVAFTNAVEARFR